MVKQFNDYVLKTDSCWLWQGRKDKDGYGKYRIDGKISNEIRAHRHAWILRFGNIPEGKQVCHFCDNPACVNPEHLWLGTPKDNMIDKVNKGRHRYVLTPEFIAHIGSWRDRAKLTFESAAQIRSEKGVTQTELARKYGVSQQLISRVLKGEIW